MTLRQVAFLVVQAFFCSWLWEHPEAAVAPWVVAAIVFLFIMPLSRAGSFGDLSRAIATARGKSHDQTTD